MTGTEPRACHHTNNLQENANMKTPRMYYGALAVFCVIALCIGYASAADITQATHTSTHGKGIVHPAFDLINTTVQQEVLARYAKQGVDTTGLAAAFQSGNMTDVKSWMEAHRPAAPGGAKGSFGKVPDYTNTTVQQKVLDRLDKQGVDTSALKAVFQNGDTAAVKSWFEAYFASHTRTAQGHGGRAKASS